MHLAWRTMTERTLQKYGLLRSLPNIWGFFCLFSDFLKSVRNNLLRFSPPFVTFNRNRLTDSYSANVPPGGFRGKQASEVSFHHRLRRLHGFFEDCHTELHRLEALRGFCCRPLVRRGESFHDSNLCNSISHLSRNLCNLRNLCFFIHPTLSEQHPW